MKLNHEWRSIIRKQFLCHLLFSILILITSNFGLEIESATAMHRLPGSVSFQKLLQSSLEFLIFVMSAWNLGIDCSLDDTGAFLLLGVKKTTAH